ncbi:MAG: hypothetical protein JSV57_01580 [Candidatus Bathyarchaeota archaeon]|nr:MAG: hypothetical protein JSV57_01580 [Candidatus Bathyarchaeota archaeon]
MSALSGRKFLAVLVFLSLVFFLLEVSGLPSGGSHPPTFTFENGDWYDSWGFNRNYYYGNDGYLPNIAYETLGANRELAYSLGEWFRADYPRRVQRAEAILSYVQRWTEYGYDADNVVMNGIPQEEWAWNADEMAHMFNATKSTIAVGDCEDMAFLCATIYIGAGFDASIVDAPEHVALLIWLPEYPNANYYWSLSDDGRGAGWIWVEATGEQNPLGWTPPDFNGGYWTAYPLALMMSNVDYTPRNPQGEDNIVVTASVMSARASVTEVSLHYSIQGEAYQILAMTPEDSVYEASISKQPEGTTVEFYVTATDSDGNMKESDNFFLTVGELEIPGFPFESIIIGLVLGIALLAFLMKRKHTLSTPPIFTCA